MGDFVFKVELQLDNVNNIFRKCRHFGQLFKGQVYLTMMATMTLIMMNLKINY